MTNRQQLHQLTLDLLDATRPPWSMGPELRDLVALLRRLAPFQIDPTRDIGEGGTPGEQGLAISPTMAALCADDIARTVTFLRGLHAAVTAARNMQTDRATRVLYAGCGPYALLALPLMSVFPQQEVVFTLLDIHEPSIASARHLINALECGDHVLRCERTNAEHHRIAPDEIPDVIVLEIMNACLEREPQVAVTRHLLPQAPGARLVPESVRIEVRLVDLRREFSTGADQHPLQRGHIPLGTVFELSAAAVESWRNETGDHLPGGSVTFPASMDRRYAPMLFTLIQAHGTHCLGEHDSGLTVPRPIPGDLPIKEGTRLRFQYRLGPNPALVCEEAV